MKRRTLALAIALLVIVLAAGRAHAAWSGNSSCTAAGTPAPCCTGSGTGTCANPLTDAPEFTANEIYDLIATDPVEGTAIGASFGGIGVSNESAQQLANRTSLLNNHRITDETNITTLLNFMAEFTGSMQPSGYIEIPFTDSSRGSIIAVVQWGAVFPNGQGVSTTSLGDQPDQTYTVTWPTAYPNACMWAAVVLSNSTAQNNTGELVMEVVGFTRTQGQFRSDLIGGVPAQKLNDGFYWVSVGF